MGKKVVWFPIHPQPANIKGGLLLINKSRIQSPNIRCAASWNNRCAASAGQTQTVAREAQTNTIAPDNILLLYQLMAQIYCTLYSKFHSVYWWIRLAEQV